MGELQLPNKNDYATMLSDELWLIVNNSKSLAKGSKSIITNNLGLYKHSEFNFQKHCYGSNGKKNKFGKERYIKKIDDIREW